MAAWDKKEITLDNGTRALAQTPVIVSASRSTDIPAFYADWFFKRLEIGYSAWTNPFNNVQSYVSYEKTRFIVFWSKNPAPLLPHLNELEARHIKCYIQYSINDYEDEKLEKVPALDKRIETFKALVNRLGKGSVIWRFDPLILLDSLGVDELLKKVEKIGNQLRGYTDKLVFSYADIALYRKVKKNLQDNHIAYKEWTAPLMLEFASKLAELNIKNRWHYELATCAEDINLEQYGIKHNRCIDADLIAKIGADDRVLLDFMGVKIQDNPQQTSLFGDDEPLPANAIAINKDQFFISIHKKDAGQRKECGCMPAKDIGQYNTCPHQCEYCYANATKALARDNWRSHCQNPFSETITGK